MFKYFIVAFILAVLTIVIATYIYLGGYKDADYEDGMCPQTKILYVEHRGAYNDINVSIERVEKWSQENQVACATTFGIFKSNPDDIVESDLISWVGCVVDAEPKNIPAGFHYAVQPEKKALIATFTGSPIMGPVKVYPKAEKTFRGLGKKIENPLEVYRIIDTKHFETKYCFYY